MHISSSAASNLANFTTLSTTDRSNARNSSAVASTNGLIVHASKGCRGGSESGETNAIISGAAIKKQDGVRRRKSAGDEARDTISGPGPG